MSVDTLEDIIVNYIPYKNSDLCLEYAKNLLEDCKSKNKTWIFWLKERQMENMLETLQDLKEIPTRLDSMIGVLLTDAPRKETKDKDLDYGDWKDLLNASFSVYIKAISGPEYFANPDTPRELLKLVAQVRSRRGIYTGSFNNTLTDLVEKFLESVIDLGKGVAFFGDWVYKTDKVSITYKELFDFLEEYEKSLS